MLRIQFRELFLHMAHWSVNILLFFQFTFHAMCQLGMVTGRVGHEKCLPITQTEKKQKKFNLLLILLPA